MPESPFAGAVSDQLGYRHIPGPKPLKNALTGAPEARG